MTRDDGSGDSLQERLAEAGALSDEGRWAEAFELLVRQEAEHPDDPVLLCMLGVAAQELGAEDAAYDYFRRCLAQNPEDPVVLVTAGVGIAAWDDPDAERVLRLAALTAPQLPLARLHYGAYLAREGLLDEAIRELEAARRLDAGDPAIRLELGTAYLLARRTEAGLAELAEALERDPQDTWLQALYGLALLEEDGRDEEAAQQLHAAAAARPQDWELQAAAALAAAAQEWDDEAWAALARAELAPGADLALLREIEERLEDGADAAREFLREEIAASLLRARLLDRS